MTEYHDIIREKIQQEIKLRSTLHEIRGFVHHILMTKNLALNDIEDISKMVEIAINYVPKNLEGT
jgi:L-arabinose isomerase